MEIEAEVVQTTPYKDQRPGTSGLRKKTTVFQQKNYLENFVQAVFDCLLAETPEGFGRETLVLGGDGRYFNKEAVQIILRMAIANGFGRVLVAAGGLLSTPAASTVIRKRKALGGFILSASHNPGGPDGDFGIKFNPNSGAPAPQSFTELVYARSKELSEYRIISVQRLDLDCPSTQSIGNSVVEVFDPLVDYRQLMQELFDFEAIGRLLAGDMSICFDAMHGITGPYAVDIFERCLGAPVGTVLRGQPLEDFGGGHPDPNLTYAADLVQRLQTPGGPEFGAASDGDGDRNMILGRGAFVSPGDSLAVILEHAVACMPGYAAGIKGAARSMPTSRAVDRVAASMDVPCFEVPTGWKYFCNLMDAGLCTICGEESFGTGSNHIREKDGIWAVLAWLSILSQRRQTVQQVLEQHWRCFGRSYFQRHDYEGLSLEAAERMLAKARAVLPQWMGRKLSGTRIIAADDFHYIDPVTSEELPGQGLRLELANSSRIVVRLSGTGTEGATLRLYLERYETERVLERVDSMVSDLAVSAHGLFGFEEHIGVTEPTVVT